MRSDESTLPGLTTDFLSRLDEMQGIVGRAWATSYNIEKAMIFNYR